MTENPKVETPQEEEGIELLDMLLVIVSERKTILRATAAAAVLSTAVALLLPGVYSARAVILPPHEDHSGLAPVAPGVLAELSSSATSGALSAAFGLKNPTDLYIGMLKSRSVEDAVVRRFKLLELYGAGSMTEAREDLEERVSVTNGTDGLISVVVEDEDPERAAAIANAYVEELENLTRRIAITEAAQRRLFIEQQIKLTQEKLAEAENSLKRTQERTGVIDLDNQGKAIIEAVADLRAQAAAKEVQISTMQSFAAPGNPDLIRARQELAGIKTQIGKLEHNNPGGNGDIMVATGRMPEAGLEYLRRLREARYQQTVYELLVGQYESARVDEARNSVVIQTVDTAVAPDEESGPRRLLIVLLATFFTSILAIMWAFARRGLARVQQDLEQNAHWLELRGLLRRP